MGHIGLKPTFVPTLVFSRLGSGTAGEVHHESESVTRLQRIDEGLRSWPCLVLPYPSNILGYQVLTKKQQVGGTI